MDSSDTGEEVSYEEYLESKVTDKDLFFLRNAAMARQLVESGMRGSVLSRAEFAAKRRERQSANEEREEREEWQRKVNEAEMEEHNEFIRALAKRTKAMRQGKMACIAYIRVNGQRGQQLSGYIDLESRLNEDPNGFVDRHLVKKKKLMPKPSDLSFVNLESKQCESHDSPYWTVSTDAIGGLVFQNKKDRRTMLVDPFSRHCATRVNILAHGYAQIVFFDHKF